MAASLPPGQSGAVLNADVQTDTELHPQLHTNTCIYPENIDMIHLYPDTYFTKEFRQQV